jgi:hypothetical protein
MKKIINHLNSNNPKEYWKIILFFNKYINTGIKQNNHDIHY